MIDENIKRLSARLAGLNMCFKCGIKSSWIKKEAQEIDRHISCVYPEFKELHEEINARLESFSAEKLQEIEMAFVKAIEDVYYHLFLSGTDSEKYGTERKDQ